MSIRKQIDLTKKIIGDQREKPKYATVKFIDGNRVDLQVMGSTGITRNVEVNGDISSIDVGDVVPILWSQSGRPVVYGSYMPEEVPIQKFSTSPPPNTTNTHSHDYLYYKKEELQTSGSSSVHWDNITNVPVAGSGDFLGLSDTPDSYNGQSGKAVAVNSLSSGLEFVEFPTSDNVYTKTELQTSGSASVHWGNITNVPSLGVSTLLELTDTPNTYTGQSGKYATVKTDETGIEFTTHNVLQYLNDLLDVNISSVADGQILTRSSGEWKNEYPTSGSAYGVYSSWDADAPPLEPSVYDDEFADSSLDASWTEWDHAGIVAISEENGFLTLTSGSSSGNKYGGVYKTIPDGDFTIETKVSISGTPGSYPISAGIAILRDPPTSGSSSSYMLYEFDLSVNTSGLFLSGSKLTAYNGTSSNTVFVYQTKHTQNSIYLRLRRTGTSTYSFDFSSDGYLWIKLGNAAPMSEFSSNLVCLFINNYTGSTSKASFQFFRYKGTEVGVNGRIGGRSIVVQSSGSAALSDYATIASIYTRTQLQTSGSSSVAYGNLTSVPSLALLGSANSFTVGPQTVSTGLDANKGFVIRANSGTQSGNLQEWQSSGGTAESLVTPSGALYLNVNGAALPSASWPVSMIVNGPIVVRSGLPTPAAPTVALAGAGAGNVDNGSHTYRITIYGPYGESMLSTAAAVNVLDKTTNGKVTVTLPAVPEYAKKFTTGYKIYRTVASGASFLYSGSKALGEASYEDNVADASLGLDMTLFTSSSSIGALRINYATSAKTPLVIVDSGVVGIGYNVFSSITSGGKNVAVGSGAGQAMTTGSQNVIVGNAAGQALTTGGSNVVVGASAALALVDGSYNFALGYYSLNENISGSNNVAIGPTTFRRGEVSNGVAIGYNAASGAVGAAHSYNVAIGALSFGGVSSGTYNTFLGSASGTAVSDGGSNVGIGAYALYSVSGVKAGLTGNVAVGENAGRGLTANSSYNLFLGYRAGYSETGSNRLYISNSSTATPLIYGEFDNFLLRIHGSQQILSSTALTNTVNPGLLIRHNSTSSATIGFGSSINFQLENASLNDVDASSIKTYWSIADNATRTSVISLSTVTNGSTSLAEKIKINGSTIQIGDVAGGNVVQIASDGMLTLLGTASVYNDVQFPVCNGRVPASNAPAWETFTTNTSEYAFSVDDFIDLQAGEPHHGWVEGDLGEGHLHVTVKSANNSGSSQYAKFTVWLAIADVSGIWSELTPLTMELTIVNGTPAKKHYLLDMGDVTLSGYHIGCQIKPRVKRIAATTGTEYSDDVYITQFGMHLKQDRIGSNTEYAV